MKHLVKFSLFEEINPRDISMIESNFNDYFTVSFEFEIETDDKDGVETRFEELDDDLIEDIITTVIIDLKIRKKSEKNLVVSLSYEIGELAENDLLDIKTLEELLDPDKYESSREKEIISHLRGSIVSCVYEEEEGYLKNKVQEHMPNFVRKWNDKIDFVGDATLDRGIEIKPKTYTKSLSESIEMINDFYSDLEKQSYWKFTEKTGLHINIGSNNKVEWNPIKGLMLLNDFNKEDKTPFMFKDMTWRMNNMFCGSLIPYIKLMSDKEKIKIKSLDLNNLKETEVILNLFLTKKVNDIGFKNLGFNITKLSSDYVEFRYAGGDIPKEVLIDKVKYCAFVVYCMTNPEYKKREYTKKLYKFIDTL